MPTKRKLGPTLATQLGGQLTHRRLHLERGAHGALGVVLVSGGDTEDGQHRVAGELFDRSLIPGDLGAQTVEGSRDEGLHQLGVARLVEAGEAHEVGEDHRGHLALAAGVGRLGCLRRR